MQSIEIFGARVVPDAAGGLWWPDQKLLAVADLHLEKGSAFAVRTAQMLPPYDTLETLRKLSAMVERLEPRTIVCLGDNFHDPEGPSRLDVQAVASLRVLMKGRRFVWIEGNHDGDAALTLGGESSPALQVGPLVFRHEPAPLPAAGEVCGHLHPVAVVETRARRVRRRCFASDGVRCVMPALGAYAGGLDVGDPAIADLFADSFTAYLLGRERVHPFVQAGRMRRSRSA